MAAGIFLKNRQIPSNSSSTRIPFGDTANRPVDPLFGSFRYNTSTGAMEYFDGTLFKTIAADSVNNPELFIGDLLMLLGNRSFLGKYLDKAPKNIKN